MNGNLTRALRDFVNERLAQGAKFGVQRHEDGTDPAYGRLAEAYKSICATAAAAGKLTWADILNEEWAEALAETDPDKLRAELVQVGAVIVAWIEDIDSRRSVTPADLAVVTPSA